MIFTCLRYTQRREEGSRRPVDSSLSLSLSLSRLPYVNFRVLWLARTGTFLIACLSKACLRFVSPDWLCLRDCILPSAGICLRFLIIDRHFLRWDLSIDSSHVYPNSDRWLAVQAAAAAVAAVAAARLWAWWGETGRTGPPPTSGSSTTVWWVQPTSYFYSVVSG
jgi:hypothetical protein